MSDRIYNEIIPDCLRFLNNAGYGKPGTPNTLWDMTKQCCEDIKKLKEENEKLRIIADIAAFCTIDLDYNLECANKEYMDGKINNGSFQRVLHRNTAFHKALKDAGYTEKHPIYDYPVVKKDE